MVLKIILLQLTMMNHHFLLWFLCLQNMKSIFINLVHILFVRQGSNDFPQLAAGDGGKSNKVDDIISFGTPRNIMDVRKLYPGRLVEEVTKKGGDHEPRRR